MQPAPPSYNHRIFLSTHIAQDLTVGSGGAKFQPTFTFIFSSYVLHGVTQNQTTTDLSEIIIIIIISFSYFLIFCLQPPCQSIYYNYVIIAQLVYCNI